MNYDVIMSILMMFICVLILGVPVLIVRKIIKIIEKKTDKQVELMQAQIDYYKNSKDVK